MERLKLIKSFTETRSHESKQVLKVINVDGAASDCSEIDSAVLFFLSTRKAENF